LDLNEWPLEWHGSKEKHYFMFPTMVKSEFLEALSQCKVKANSMPRKTEMYLEYRMYGLVPYNISPIQQGIQFGHAVVEYGQTVKGLSNLEKIYNKWAKEDKTFIILNGGTTNNNVGSLGTLNKHLQTLKDNDVLTAEFNEPDLGDQLTAIVFLVDERVFNKELYPDFVGTPYTWPSHKKPSDREYEKWKEVNDKNYVAWVERIGGEKNAFLRDYLKTFRLA
jgi:hypothetical protein